MEVRGVSVSDEYLKKVRRAVRRAAGNEDVDAELLDLIAECRADLVSAGVKPDKAEDESDPMIAGAVRCFCRWKFGLDEADSAANAADYIALKDNLRRMKAYRVEAADGME